MAMSHEGARLAGRVRCKLSHPNVECYRGRNAHSMAAHDEIANTLLDIIAREEDVDWLSAAVSAEKEGAAGDAAVAAQAGSDAAGPNAVMALAALRELLMLCQVGCCGRDMHPAVVGMFVSMVQEQLGPHAHPHRWDAP